MKEKLKKLRSFFMDESGQGMVEYILIIGLIVLFILVVLLLFRNAISAMLQKVIAVVKGQTGPIK